MQAFTTLTSRVVALPVDNIDTDQIIPARYLTTTSKAGLGQALFDSWRHATDGTLRPEFPLNRPEVQGAQVLLAGDNFGSGSSREHAAWALADYGFRVIISTSFADIFRNNALKNGLLPLIVDAETHRQLLDQVQGDNQATVTIDLASQTLTLPGGQTATFPIDAFSRHCLLEGVDELGYLMNLDPQIATYEKTHPARVYTGVFEATGSEC